MSKNEWFRCKEWTAENKRLFFERLSRARSNRDQYVAIQAGTLAENDPDAALELSKLYFATRTNDFNDNVVYIHRAKAYASKDDLDNAVKSYQAAVQREIEFPNSLSDAAFDLALLIAMHNRTDDFPAALSALEFADKEDLMLFPSEIFKWHAAHALIASSQSQPEFARQHARYALEASSKTESGFRYYPKVGLVTTATDDLIANLDMLAK